MPGNAAAASQASLDLDGMQSSVLFPITGVSSQERSTAIKLLTVAAGGGQASEHGKTEEAKAVNDLIDSILARPEHQWYEAETKKKVAEVKKPTRKEQEVIDRERSGQQSLF